MIWSSGDKNLCIGKVGIAAFAAIYIGVIVPVTISTFRGNCPAPVTGEIPAANPTKVRRDIDSADLPRDVALIQRGQPVWEYRWEKSDSKGGDCDTTMSPQTIVSVLNDDALSFVRALKLTCAVFTLDNSGSFTGTLKLAYEDGTSIYNACW